MRTTPLPENLIGPTIGNEKAHDCKIGELWFLRRVMAYEFEFTNYEP
jgi:hypothetical protein